MKRLLDLANQQLVYMVLFVAMTVTSSPGPTWPTVAKYCAAAASGIGVWTLKDRLSQQDRRDDAQDNALKEFALDNRNALKEFGQSNKEAFTQVRDLSASAVSRAGEAISAGLELKNSVNDLKNAVGELKEEIKDERLKREQAAQKELEELRQKASQAKGAKG